MVINKKVICNLLMRNGKQVLTENLKLRAIANAGIAAFCFAETGGYKMIKKEKKNQGKKVTSEKNFFRFSCICFCPFSHSGELQFRRLM